MKFKEYTIWNTSEIVSGLFDQVNRKDVTIDLLAKSWDDIMCDINKLNELDYNRIDDESISELKRIARISPKFEPISNILIMVIAVVFKYIDPNEFIHAYIDSIDIEINDHRSNKGIYERRIRELKQATNTDSIIFSKIFNTNISMKNPNEQIIAEIESDITNESKKISDCETEQRKLMVLREKCIIDKRLENELSKYFTLSDDGELNCIPVDNSMKVSLANKPLFCENTDAKSFDIDKIFPGKTIKSIGSHCFCFCKTIEQLYIPNTITEIGDNAFYGCSGLQDLYIPTNVENMGMVVSNIVPV